VSIGDSVFIGANATILMGVTIGDHAVIGAGAVVNHDVEAYSIVAGVPARRIGTVKLNGSDVTFDYE
jgi:acetyltransferase-like isoleucine patch superfamily enzyme